MTGCCHWISGLTELAYHAGVPACVTAALTDTEERGCTARLHRYARNRCVLQKFIAVEPVRTCAGGCAWIESLFAEFLIAPGQVRCHGRVKRFSLESAASPLGAGGQGVVVVSAVVPLLQIHLRCSVLAPAQGPPASALLQVYSHLPAIARAATALPLGQSDRVDRNDFPVACPADFVQSGRPVAAEGHSLHPPCCIV